MSPTYLESVTHEWFSQRVVSVVLVVLAAYTVLFARLFYLQVIEGDEYRRLSEINSIRLHDIDAPRGLVFDRQGRMLVDNRPSFDLHIILKDAKPLDETLSRLGRITGLPVSELKEQIRTHRNRGGYTPILLKEDVGRDLLAAIEVQKYDLPGVMVEVSPRRHYLQKERAAHLLGYMGEISQGELQQLAGSGIKSGDFIGKYGIEKSYENSLRGRRGGRQVEVNATGQVVRILDSVDAVAGQNIVLTVDLDTQIAAENALAGWTGAVVAIDPDNGEVIAMASSPTFDPNLFVVGMSRDQWNALITNPYRPLENKAVQAEYPPASTYKIITALAGLEEKVIDPETTFYCPGHYRYGNRVYRCWKRGGHGEVDLTRAIAESCDVYFYQVGEAVGVDRLAHFASACGLGASTGIDLGQEANGLVPTMNWKLKRLGEPWQGGETLSVAIGQGFNLITPLQLASTIAAVGNGGTQYRPQLVKKMVSVENTVTYEAIPEVIGRIPSSNGTMELIRHGLWSAVNHNKGTAYASRIKDLEFCGKTGTAQVVSRPPDNVVDQEEIDEMLKDHALFVAYAPAQHPRIAVSVIIEHGEHGSSAAAPIAREVIRTYLRLPEDKMSESLKIATEQRVEARRLKVEQKKLAAENDSKAESETESEQAAAADEKSDEKEDAQE
jgi:penicillin-binding protein 2